MLYDTVRTSSSPKLLVQYLLSVQHTKLIGSYTTFRMLKLTLKKQGRDLPTLEWKSNFLLFFHVAYHHIQLQLMACLVLEKYSKCGFLAAHQNERDEGGS